MFLTILCVYAKLNFNSLVNEPRGAHVIIEVAADHSANKSTALITVNSRCRYNVHHAHSCYPLLYIWRSWETYKCISKRAFSPPESSMSSTVSKTILTIYLQCCVLNAHALPVFIEIGYESETLVYFRLGIPKYQGKP